jgi:uncharacterized protein (TIGR04255 family)
MPDASSISIDRSKQFEHLAKAPIVEAVIEFRARAEARWGEADISGEFKGSLPDYSDWRRASQGSFKAEFRLAPKDGEQPAGTPPAIVEHAWLGLRGEGADGRYVATFARDGFSLSRLAPYDSWDPFRDEAMRLWEIHRRVAEPTEVQRLGVRFINRIEVPAENLRLNDYLEGLGQPPAGLPSASFLYRDSLGVPGHAYLVHVVRTVQAPEQGAGMLALLVDIDAIDPEPSPAGARTIHRRLEDLRWLKNKVFFGSLTRKAMELYR